MEVRTMSIMSDDAKAILLLSGRFGENKDDCEPLPLRNYNRLVHWLVDREQRPADLLGMADVSSAASAAEVDESRFKALLNRGVQLGFAVEQWNRSGIWIVCRSDPDYPARYKSRLKQLAPPVLFGAGERALLRGGGLAIVGSRNVDEAGEQFTRDVASWCARAQVPVVSGGARGVDQTAMLSALGAGGSVIGVLSNNLLRASVSKDARQAIADHRLLLVSPVHPAARFTVGTAMGRNKLIYAMADMGLIVSADCRKGGTWAGAEEELKRLPPRPVFVRSGGDAPEGNRRLLELGAAPFPQNWRGRNPMSIRESVAKREVSEPSDEFPLFSKEIAEEHNDPVEHGKESSQHDDAAINAFPVGMSTGPTTIYEAVLGVLLNSLEKPSSVEELTARLDVKKNQLQSWLKQAVTEKKVKKLTRPVRYVRCSP